MAVEAYFFSHDYNSRNDRKMVALQMKEGMAGVGCYWCIVEMLYEEGGYVMLSECDRIAYDLRVKPELINRVVINYDLFRNDGQKFWSETALRRMNERLAKSKQARESALERWNKRNGDANAKRTQSDSNAIEERKGEERKGEREEKETSPSQVQVFGIHHERNYVLITPKIIGMQKYRINGVDGLREFYVNGRGTLPVSDEVARKFLSRRSGSVFNEAGHLINAINQFNQSFHESR